MELGIAVHYFVMTHFHFPDYIDTRDDLAEDDMLVVQPLGALCRQEELRAIAVRS